MSKKDNFNKEIQRRKFLKTAAAGICGLGLFSGISKGSVKGNLSGNSSGAQRGLIGAKSSKWFTDISRKKIRCRLCPRSCELSEGERSYCRVRENRGGEGYSLVYGTPALIQEDPIERKPFFHVRPGSRALSISTAGCNLSCKFCEVWDMALSKPEEIYAYNFPPDKVVSKAVSSGVKSVSYAFGEPVIFYEYMAETARHARKEGLLNIMHTAAFIQPEPMEKLCSYIDAVNVDLKSFDPSFYRDVVGGELEPVLDTLKLLKKQGIHIEITNIIIPTLNDDERKVGEMCEWIVKELGTEVPLHFARFYPLYKLSSLPRTPVSTLDKAREIAMKSGLKYVYVARVTGHKAENTFCPGCGESIIDRIGFVVDRMEITEGNCKYCGQSIKGLW